VVVPAFGTTTSAGLPSNGREVRRESDELGGAVRNGGTHSSAFVHDALVYSSPDELVDVAAPFLLEGLAAGEAAVVAAGADTAALIRAALGDDPRVYVLPRSDVYRQRTPAAITAFRRLAEERAVEGLRVRVVGETDFGATPRDWQEWQRYEAVINDALGAWPLWGLCIFDTRRLPDQVLEAVHRTHPNVVLPGGGRRTNARFADPGAYLRALPIPREPLEDTPPRLSATGITDFIGLRHAVAAVLADLGGDRDAGEDFLLAVDEMTSNAVRHGRPPVDLRLWVSEERVVCRITDRGTGLDDPFAGYGPAHGADLSRGGMGLWLARQLCDHVDITDDGGVTVRLVSRLR
jgi:anti-sigma regulatory factor (Ser/Thr protein kinase)